MSDLSLTWPGQHKAHSLSGAGSEIKERALAIVLANEGKTFHAFGDEVRVLMGGAETEGCFTIFIGTTPPGGGPPPHYHAHEDEWFLPLEGRVEFFLNGSWKEVPLQSFVFLPRGTVHTFRNCGDTPLKMLTHTTPAGFEIFFARCAAEFAKDGPPDMAHIVEISAEHGIHFVTE